MGTADVGSNSQKYEAFNPEGTIEILFSLCGLDGYPILLLVPGKYRHGSNYCKKGNGFKIASFCLPYV